MTSPCPQRPRNLENIAEEGGLQEQIGAYGPWFHNMNVGGVATAPDHFLGDFPAVKWRHIETAIAPDLSGKTVLDIGCNAGFYAQELYKRGASRVVGIDTNERYLEQARFAAKVNQCDIEFRKLSVYQLEQLDEVFDLILFLGVFYHLRYPLFALDRVVEKLAGQLFLQSLLRPSARDYPVLPAAADYPFAEQHVFANEPGFPRMHFIEESFAGDPTNWWLPNGACVEAILRSSGLKITGRPEEETWLCEPDVHALRGRALQEEELSGRRS